VTREIFLVGSIRDRGEPVQPADAVFDAYVRNNVASLMRYVPDGEQTGWAPGVSLRVYDEELFEPTGAAFPLTRRPTTFFDRPRTQYALREGRTTEDIAAVELGIADVAAHSYESFKKLKDAGKFSSDARFAATLAGPGTLFARAALPLKTLRPLILEVFVAEIRRIVAAIPSEDLAVQLDLAAEPEYEEVRRRPDAFDNNSYAYHQDWDLESTSSMIMEIANTLPEPVHLGFHLCAMYHIDESQGQDLNVHVDWANAICAKAARAVNYIHIPTVPSHTASDFAVLDRLALHRETRLELGVIHIENGIDGARGLVNAAAESYPEFGVSAFCGLAQPSRKEYSAPHSLDEILQLHREVADL
jgi:hypothetical protein